MVPVAAGLTAVLAVVGLPGRHDSASAGWTAIPTGVAAPDWAQVADQCMATSKKEFDGDLSRAGDLAVVLAERRGQWTYALLANDNNVASCLQNENTTVGTAITQSSGKEVAPRPAARGVTYITLSGGDSIATTYGRAGADVAKVVVNEPEGRVTATVKGGFWAAWWPSNEATRPFPYAPSRYSLTITLRDGTQLPPFQPWPESKN